MKKQSGRADISIMCGKTTNSFEELKILCEEEAEKLSKLMEISNQEIISVPFWTTDFPELVCVGIFKRHDNGSIVYELDFSESTL